MKVFKINLGGEAPSPMQGRFWTKALVMALAIFIASLLFNFVEVSSPLVALVAAIVLSLLNAFLRPLLTLISAPLILFSFGLFRLIINAVLVLLTSHLVKGFTVESFTDAICFSITVTIISYILDLAEKIRQIKRAMSQSAQPQSPKEEEFTSYTEVEEDTETDKDRNNND